MICDSCGNELIEGMKFCVHCGKSIETPYQTKVQHGQETPAKIIPFVVTDQQARKEFQAWLSKGFWAPRNMKKISTINELSPLYVPVWLFSAVATSKWSGQSGMRRSRQVAYKVQEGNTEKTEYETEYYTDWYPVTGEHDGIYSSLPIPASQELVNHVSKMKRFNESILPIVDGYDYSTAEPFDVRYVTSCPVDTNLISIDDASLTFKKRVKDAETKECLKMIPGDEKKLDYINLSISDIKHELAYVPIYLSSYYYKRRLYHFLINGKTNKIVSEEKPISPAKVVIALVIFIALILLVAHFW